MMTKKNRSTVPRMHFEQIPVALVPQIATTQPATNKGMRAGDAVCAEPAPKAATGIGFGSDALSALLVVIVSPASVPVFVPE